MTTKPTEYGMIAALRQSYTSDSYTVIPQVPDRTGGGANRIADALLVSLWPSKGLWVAGIEVKVSRSDWLRELKDFAKAETISQYCDYWYILASDVNIVRRDELPVDWGLMVAHEGKVKTVVKAPRRPVVAWPASFLVSVLRSAREQVCPRSDIEAEIYDAAQKARKEGFKSGEDSMRRSLEHKLRNMEELERAIQQFEEQSGVRFSQYSSGNLVKAMQYLKTGGIENDRKQLSYLEGMARNISNEIQEQLKNFDEAFSEQKSPA